MQAEPNSHQRICIRQAMCESVILDRLKTSWHHRSIQGKEALAQSHSTNMTQQSHLPLLPSRPRPLMHGWMDILADLIAQLSSTVLFERLCPCSYQVQAVPRNNNDDELNSMLFEFLWFHITSCIFSHRYVIPKTLLIAD